MSDSFFDLVAKLDESLTALDIILSGGNDDTASINGHNKDSISKAIKTNFYALNSLMQGRKAYETLIDLKSDNAIAIDGSVLAEVWRDGANNGVYGYRSGKWELSTKTDLVLMNKLNTYTRPWLADGAAILLSNNELIAVSAIKGVEFVSGQVPGEVYKIINLCNNHPSYQDAIFIQDSQSNNVAEKAGTITKSASGLTMVEVGTAVKFRLWIDYKALPNAFYHAGNNIKLDPYAIHPIDQKAVDAVSAIATQTAENITAIKKTSAVANRTWLNLGASQLFTDDDLTVVKAVHYVEVVSGQVPGEVYKIVNLCKDHPSYQDAIVIQDNQSNPIASIAGAVSKAASGLTMVELGTTVKFKLWIDYAALPSGTIFISDNIKIDPYAIYPVSQKNIDSVNAIATQAANNIIAVKKTVEIANRTWLNLGASQLFTDDDLTVAKAVHYVEAVSGQVPGEVYKIINLCKDHPSYQDAIFIQDSQSQNVASKAGVVNKAASGLTMVEVGTAVKFKLWIDYAALPPASISVGSNIKIDPYAIYPVSQKNIDSVNAIATQAASNIVSVKKTVEIANRAWLNLGASQLFADDDFTVVKAIHYVEAVSGQVPGEVYKIVNLCNNHPSYQDAIFIQDSQSKNVASKAGVVNKAASGLTMVEVGTAVKFKLWIDYSALPSGTIFISNNIKIDPYVIHPVSMPAVQAAFGGALSAEALKNNSPVFSSQWLHPESLLLLSANELIAAKAVKYIEAVSGQVPGEVYKIINLCSRHTRYLDNIFIQDSQSKNVAIKAASIVRAASGLTMVEVGTAVKFRLWIDYSILPDEFVHNDQNLKINPYAIYPASQKTVAALQPGILNTNSTLPKIPAKALRVSCAGSSVTWGDGTLSTSHVEPVEEYLRHELAQTIHANEMTITGSSIAVAEVLAYKGALKKLVGVGASASCVMSGDEVSVCIARERGNDGAAVIECYIDGVLYDTFSTWNDEEHQSGVVKSFVGDGSTVQFPLGVAFSYNHAVSVGGVAKIGALNTQGYGALFPAGHDFMVIRKAVIVGEKVEIQHLLFFSTPPASGAAISVNCAYGRSVLYAQTTIGNVGKSLGSGIESAYGDGATSYDPANPAALSTGLDFRQTDSKSIVFWRFNISSTRAVKLVVKSLDPRATGTPNLFINFITNRMHHLQNAGIGGFKASDFLATSGLRTSKQISEFRPDLVCLNVMANDDWNEHQWKAYRTVSGLTSAQLKGVESALWVKSVVENSTDNYTIQDTQIQISAIDSYGANLLGTNATFSIERGDVVILGDFKQDVRRLTARLIDNWDSSTKRLTWVEPLMAGELAHINVIGDLVGSYAQVMNASGWRNNVLSIIFKLKTVNPSLQFSLGLNGPPNYFDRTTVGYRELAADMVDKNAISMIDNYGFVRDWQFSQRQSTPLYLNDNKSILSTGANDYTLFKSTGIKPTDKLLRNIRIKVNGIERTNKGCHLSGGYTRSWDISSGLTLLNAKAIRRDHKLVFTSDKPPAGAEILITYSESDIWSSDDTHPNQTMGAQVIGAAVVDWLRSAVNFVLSSGKFRR